MQLCGDKRGKALENLSFKIQKDGYLLIIIQWYNGDYIKRRQPKKKTNKDPDEIFHGIIVLWNQIQSNRKR